MDAPRILPVERRTERPWLVHGKVGFTRDEAAAVVEFVTGPAAKGFKRYLDAESIELMELLLDRATTWEETTWLRGVKQGLEDLHRALWYDIPKKFAALVEQDLAAEAEETDGRRDSGADQGESGPE